MSEYHYLNKYRVNFKASDTNLNLKANLVIVTKWTFETGKARHIKLIIRKPQDNNKPEPRLLGPLEAVITKNTHKRKISCRKTLETTRV